MTTVVQRVYRPQIAPAVAGMIADMAGSEVGTRQCETVAGIGFGLAVSQGSRDKGCVIGGSSFIGVSVRDITLNPVPLDPLSDAAVSIDVYSQYANMAVLSRGHIWVLSHALVVAGDALYYDTTSGLFGGSGGQMASGYIDFTAQPKAEDTVTIGSAGVITFKASGASGDQANIGATLGDTIANLAAAAEASSTGDIEKGSYKAWPPSPGGRGEGSGAYRLLISAEAGSTTDNSTGIATNVVGATVSAATMAGGVAAGTLIAGGYWMNSAISGELAKISLGIQR